MAEAKKLSPFDATLLVMGGIVGVGIFFAPHQIARLVPDPTVFLGMWVFGALIALCGALTFAEWGGSFPDAGGWYVFLRQVYPPWVAFLFAWVVLGVISTGAIAVIASIGATNLFAAFPSLIGALPAGETAEMQVVHVVCAATFIVVLTIVTMFGARAGASVQNLCMITKAVAIAALVAGAFAFFQHDAGVAEAAVFTPDRSLVSGVVAATLPVFFAFGGWQHVCYIAPEVHDPARTLPRAIVLGVVGVAVIYLAANIGYVRALGIDGLATHSDVASQAALHTTLGEPFKRAVSACVAVSAFGVCAVNIIVTPGIYVAMAREGLFFEGFGKLHAKTRAPVVALLTQGVLALAYLYWSFTSARPPRAASEGFRMDINLLTSSVVFAEWIFHGLVAWGLLWIRKNRPDLPRPFRSPLWPLAPTVYVVTAAVIVIGNLFSTDITITGVGLAVLAAGALVYRPWRRLTTRIRRDL